MWVETVTEGGQRFMAAGRKEERSNETGKLIIADGSSSVEFCEATPIGLVHEPKVSLYGRETYRDLRSACRCVA